MICNEAAAFGCAKPAQAELESTDEYTINRNLDSSERHQKLAADNQSRSRHLCGGGFQLIAITSNKEAASSDRQLALFASMDSSVHVLVTEEVCCPAKSTAMSMPVISSSVVYLPLYASLYLLSMNTCMSTSMLPSLLSTLPGCVSS